MEIRSVKIDGFANLDKVQFDLSKFNALVALNNFGKSNVLTAIDFGINFIVGQSSRKNMMAFRPVIPINTTLENRPFSFEIDLQIQSQKKEEIIIRYGYAFDWIKNKKDEGQRIRSEILKIKSGVESKFTTYLHRDLQEARYLPSETGRCDRRASIGSDELLISKLKNFDELFYQDILRLISSIRIIPIDTLENPDSLFRTIEPTIVRTDYSLDIPRESDAGYFIFSLVKKEPDLFAIFKDSILSLLPDIEDFEPVEMDLKMQNGKQSHSDIPLDFPDKFYEIMVKEKNNNQKTPIRYLSSGSKRIFFVLAMTIAAELNGIPLIMFEELENSIHPSLLQKLLIVLDGLTEKTKILTTSHSPYLIKYLDWGKIKIGIPNDRGTAQFEQIRKSKTTKLINMAVEQGISLGDIIFNSMVEDSVGGQTFLHKLCTHGNGKK